MASGYSLFSLYSVSSLWLLEQKFVLNIKLLAVKGKSEFKTALKLRVAARKKVL